MKLTDEQKRNRAWKRFFNKWKKNHPNGFTGLQLIMAQDEFLYMYNSKIRARRKT